MKKDSTVNTFQDGLIMDLNPILTPNTALTNCLNGTIVTFNGNENVLQNDMGNGRVETAYLPEGYVPVGTTELGGIIYIVSYNPLKDKCQIGCFPSPERNITSDEIKGNNNSVDTSKFRNSKNEITTTEYKVELLPDDTKLNPGDQYSIYATNKGITNNFDYLSFIGNTNHTMDNYEEENCPYRDKNSQIYKNVEIHVVSISDDGKITYLDDSVKWFENTFIDEINKESFPADYYIKEVEGEGDDAINNDIESYRSLVSTAYNIFNSKTSGKLALLFKLNVIDTFSATWNINDINDINDYDISGSDYNQEATIAIEMNYTSKHSTINLSNVESNVEIGKSILAYYIKDGHIISKIDNPEVFQINYDDIDINKQDGKHIEKISKYMFQYDKNKENKIKYTLTPCMSFGKLTYLNKGFTIHLNKIGSGDMNVTGWRYFSTPNDVTIDLGLETYPKKGDIVEKIELVFYDPSNTVGNNDAVQLLSELSKSDDYIIKQEDEHGVEYLDKSIETINNKSGYSGNIQHKIYLNDDTYPRNCLFLVDILIVVKTRNGKFEYNHNPRFLYTCGIFNSKYYEVNDFNELSIDEFISPEAIVTTKKNTLDNTKTEIPTEEEISSLCQILFDKNADDKEKKDYYYKTMSVQKTTINGEIEYDSKIIDKNWSELFMYYYDKPEVKHSVNYKDANPKADTNSDKYTECVKHIYSNELPSDFPEPLIVGSETDNGEYKDYFYIYRTSSNTIKVYGVLYSRMNAKVEEKTVSSNNCLRPVLLNTTELDDLGLRIYKNNTYSGGLNNGIIKPEIGFIYKYGMYTGDHGGGDSFYLQGRKCTKTGENYWDEINDWTEIENNTSPDGDFNADGSFTTTWKNVNTYRTVFNNWMESDNNLFAIWFFNYANNSKAMQKWKDSKSITNADGRNYAIMVRTNDIFIPIAHFNTVFQCSEYVKMIISLFCHLYYLTTNTHTEMTAPVVTNINYLKDYTVNLNINLAFNISGAEVVTKSGEYDLTKPSNKKYKNIYILKDEQNSDFPNPIGKIKPHSFFIKNDELYNYYNSHKSNKVNCIIQTLEGPIISNKNFDVGYVYFDCRTNIGLDLKDYFIKVSDLIDLNLPPTFNIPRIVLNDDNKLEKATTQPIYFHVYNDFLRCLEIKNDKLCAESYKLVDDNGIMKTAEPSRGGTHYNITFKGGTSKQIGYY